MSTADRRTFLKALGLGAGLVPLLDAPRARSAPTAKPRRVVILAVPNGFTNGRDHDYYPVGGEADWRARTEAEAPFSPMRALDLPGIRERVRILGGINVQNGNDTAQREKGTTMGGHAILPFLLTGAMGVSGPAIPDGWNLTAGHASVDQYIASKLPSYDVPFKSLVMRTTRMEGYGSQPLSYSGATLDGGKSHNAPTIRDDPQRLFDDLFGADLTTDQQKALRKKRASILDLHHTQLGRLLRSVGRESRVRIEEHVAGIESLQKRLSTTSACTKPTRLPDGPSYVEQLNLKYDQIVRAQSDMIVAALACDLTRVVTNAWSSSNNNTVVFPFLAKFDPSIAAKCSDCAEAGSGNDFLNHHTIAHNDQRFRTFRNLIDRFYLEEFAYIIRRLTETKEADGTPLIDNTLVLLCHMQRTGGGHQVEDLIWLLGGNVDAPDGGGKYFKGGQYLRHLSGKGSEMTPSNGVLTALVNAMGCPPVTHFGDAKYGGEATRLRA